MTIVAPPRPMKAVGSGRVTGSPKQGEGRGGGGISSGDALEAHLVVPLPNPVQQLLLLPHLVLST